jgi:Winged helix DNA-binding domain
VEGVAKQSVLTDADIARWRLHNQHLTSPFTASAEDTVVGLLAVQAENPSQAAWAVASRTRRPSADDLAKLLDDGTVLRTHVLRSTWHFVSADDIGWLLDLTRPRVLRVTGEQLETAYGLDDGAIDLAATVVLDALGERADRTRSELGEVLQASGVVPRGQLLMVLLAHLELNGLICSGRPVDGEHSYALLSERAPNTRRLDRAEALAELALRYFTSHGPATEKDLAYWATLAVTDVRAGLAEVKDRLETFEHAGRTYWHAPGDPPPPGQEPRGHLLQILDECYRGYQDSRWVLDSAGNVPRGREAAIGMALVDGQMVAAMRRNLGKGRVEFALEPYRPLRSGEVDTLADAADRYGAFLNLPASIRLLNRHREGRGSS